MTSGETAVPQEALGQKTPQGQQNIETMIGVKKKVLQKENH